MGGSRRGLQGERKYAHTAVAHCHHRTGARGGHQRICGWTRSLSGWRRVTQETPDDQRGPIARARGVSHMGRSDLLRWRRSSATVRHTTTRPPGSARPSGDAGSRTNWSVCPRAVNDLLENWHPSPEADEESDACNQPGDRVAVKAPLEKRFRSTDGISSSVSPAVRKRWQSSSPVLPSGPPSLE